MWLGHVGCTNSDSRIVANYFVGCVRQVDGRATVMRADYGIENGKLAGIQRFLCITTMILCQEAKASCMASLPRIRGLKPGGVSYEEISVRRVGLITSKI